MRPPIDTAPGADIASGLLKTEFDTPISCTTNLLGVKGVGELSTVGAAPVAGYVIYAVIDAATLAGQGRVGQRMQMPLTPSRIWRAATG